ncbi:MAG TPA: PDDEXK nuclease domain-containing protein [Coriobacteriia bacterium]
MNEIDRVAGSAADEDALFGDVSQLIESARTRAAAAVNSELVMLYWHVGKRVREDVLGGEKAEYGRQVTFRLAERLTQRYGRGYGWRNLFRMVKFAEVYPEPEILSTLSTRLSWSSVTEILTLDDRIKRDFYLALCARERWSVRTLRAQICGKLYERTIAARGSDASIEAEIAALRDDGTTTPALAFRDPYVLDFLGLPAKHSESDLEQAILDDMRRFLSELGVGFAFVERQKRIVVDDKDYHLDLLFYHRYLRCLVAIELKTRDLEPGDYGQMLLYLRWLQAHDTVPGEELPIGLILCAGKGPEQTALLGIDQGEIRAARYITQPLIAEMRRRLTSTARGLP